MLCYNFQKNRKVFCVLLEYIKACQACVRLRMFLSFIMKVLFTFLYLSSPNLIENDYFSCFLTLKYQLSNTLSHNCFEKMPKS